MMAYTDAQKNFLTAFIKDESEQYRFIRVSLRDKTQEEAIFIAQQELVPYFIDDFTQTEIHSWEAKGCSHSPLKK